MIDSVENVISWIINNKPRIYDIIKENRSLIYELEPEIRNDWYEEINKECSKRINQQVEIEIAKDLGIGTDIIKEVLETIDLETL